MADKTLKVQMSPNPQHMAGTESGIRRVVDAYAKYFPQYGIELVPVKSDDFDLLVIHAGTSTYLPPDLPLYAHCHGLYWTADYIAETWEYRSNRDVIDTLRAARGISVPSEWVAKTLRRDMRINPDIIPHGIDWEDWQEKVDNNGYVLWNKNRTGDVCDPRWVAELARRHEDVNFISTFDPGLMTDNIEVIGLQPHEQMKRIVQAAGVYLSTTKETFGIGVLEALASGVPVLGFAYGGNLDLVEHGVDGYLAEPGNLEDLEFGLNYCLIHRKVLGANARQIAKRWSWPKVVARVASLYRTAIAAETNEVSVIIPSYNYGEKVGRAIESVLNQTYPVKEVIVVDDASPDAGETRETVHRYTLLDPRVQYIRQPINSGVAVARNTGIEQASGNYICCLDADDALAPRFIEACIQGFKEDPRLALAFTGLQYVLPDGRVGTSQWPDGYDYDRFLKGHNQVPTCCVYRKEAWRRIGGYKSRYCPNGAGAEDAEFFLRMGAYGFTARQVTEAPLFIYSWQSGMVSGNPDYKEMDWTQMHPWTRDGLHPLASLATPARLSHPIRQYDAPLISVIIPVGPGHEKEVINSLDSLEAQTFRNWEVVVVADCDVDLLKKSLDPYPYVNLALLDKTRKQGAGAARNLGVSISSAPLLVFLDADDWLYPEALEILLREWEYSQAIIYSDYVGKATVGPENLGQFGQRVLQFNSKNNEAVILHNSFDYDCARAVTQPNPDDMYIWSLVTSLVPKVWHKEIGGFDEVMPSWEDWDYWIRLAKAGKCFRRVPEPLVVYRFNTGSRREVGGHEYQSLIEYLNAKYKKVQVMPCNCGGSPSPAINSVGSQNQSLMAGQPTQADEVIGMQADTNFVLVTYAHPNRGQHRVVGASTQTDYGYRGGGERFYVHKNDIAAQPDLYIPVVETKQVETPKEAPEPLPAPTPIGAVKRVQPTPRKIEETLPAVEEKKVEAADIEGYENLQAIPGVNGALDIEFNRNGYHTVQAIADMTIAQLEEINGIGPAKARTIKAAATRMVSGNKT